MRVFSEIGRRRWLRFKSKRRAYLSLLLLGGAFVLSLFSEVFVNDKPVVLRYDGGTYFPVVKFYPATTFGGSYRTEPFYPDLQKDEAFKAKGGWMLFPIIPHGPIRSHLDLEGSAPHPPSWDHWLGTDSAARDVLARLVYGFRVCMLFSLSLVVEGTVLGIIVGSVQGYLGGKVDLFAQRLIEIWASLPFLYVVILFGSIYGQSFWLLVVVIGLFEWIGLSYYMRGEFLRLKGQTYVSASRALGASHVRIVFKQILPNAMGPVLTILPFSLISGIGSLTALDFLGFGLAPPTPSWGELLGQGLKNLYAPWISVSTVTVLFLTLLLATFIGEGVREAYDPKSASKLR